MTMGQERPANTDSTGWRGGKPSRRDMVRTPLVLAGVPLLCCETPDVPPASIEYADGSVTIDLRRAPGLASPGVAGKIVDRERKWNIIVTQPEKGRFVVLDRQCTHGGGQVAYNRNRRTVQCTCWGHSEFNLSGAVVGGPAKRPLRVYVTRVAAGKLEILREAAR